MIAEPAILALEDGTLWHGTAFGARGTKVGEVVFNTSMTGYQEVLTDPSYYEQIVVMTTPHIGNTGVNAEDEESYKCWLSGFVIREASPRVSNWRATQSLDDYLRAKNVVAISNLDTRALVRHIRSQGAMRAALSNVNPSPQHLVGLACQSPSMNGLNLVDAVTCEKDWKLEIGDGEFEQWYPISNLQSPTSTYSVIAFDYGIKHNILRLLHARGCRVTVVPAKTSANEILALKPDGVFLSNGPGDPAAVTSAIETIRQLLGRIPIFGICLGHQILALALDGETYKLKFGHRGANQPVKNLLTGRVEITTHNHGFAVRAESLPRDVEITQVNLNDQCVEGLRTRERKAFSVQFHPEAAAGPHDALALFDDFIALMAGQS